jgi:SAM-dependent methyltransferase
MLRGLTRELDTMVGQTIAKNARVLDYGCGSMPYRALVERHGAHYVGADFEAGAAVEIQPDGRLPVASDSFDAILSVQVLEHVRDLDLYLAEACRILKDEGVLLLSTHGTWLYHPHPEDHRRWTRTGLVHDIEARGFEVHGVESIVGPLATSTMIRLTGYAFFLRRLPLIGRPLAGLLAVIINVRGWLEDKLTPSGIRRDNGCIFIASCTKGSR